MGEKVTNLTIHDPKKAVEQSGVSNALVIDDYKNGFRLERYHSIEGGIGISGRWWFDNASGVQAQIMPFVGLIPIAGSKSYSIQYTKNAADLNRLPRVSRAPDKADELSKWAVGDSVTHTAEGGLLYFGGLNYGFGSIAAIRFAKGEWTVYVQKTTETTAYVKITKGKLKVFSISVAGPFSNRALSQFSDDDKSFSYLVDLKTETGRKVYEDLVRGNLAAAQKFAEEGVVAKVIDTQVVSQKGKFFNTFLGIPILLNTTLAKGTVTTVSKTNVKIDDSKVDVTYGVYTKERRNRFLANHSSKTAVFYGAKYTITDRTGPAKGYFGKYSLSYADDNTSNGNLKSIVADLVKKSGLKSTLEVKVPEKVKMDYAGAHLDITFSEANTDRMIEAAGRLAQKDFVRKYGEPFVRNFAKKDELNVCGGQADQACIDSERGEMRGALEDMHKALREMKTLAGNDVEFTKAYARFGRALSKNGMLVQSAIQMAGEGVEIYLRIEGERASVYEKLVTSTGRSVETREIAAPGQAMPNFIPDSGADRQRGILIAPKALITSPVNSK